MGDGTRLTRLAYASLIEDDIGWLRSQVALERHHIIAVLRASVDLLYPQPAVMEREWTVCTKHDAIVTGACRACAGEVHLVQVRVAKSPTVEAIREAVTRAPPTSPDLTLPVHPSDDPLLSCLLCSGAREHISRPLAISYYTPRGRVTVGLHQDCYDRARTPMPKEAL